MNAVVHAGGGTGRVYTDGQSDKIQVWIQDQGSGIAMERLPHATLQRGFTTAVALGHGFKMMLHTARGSRQGLPAQQSSLSRSQTY